MAIKRIFLDTEFTELPWTGTSELLWVGLVDDGGRRWSAVNSEVDPNRSSQFVRKHVLPLIPEQEPRLTREELATQIVRFCGKVNEFWAWFPTLEEILALGAPSNTAPKLLQQYADWDFQLLTSLVAPPPVAWPSHCNDVHALALRAGVSPPINERPHHPLHDAAWNRDVFVSATDPGGAVDDHRHRADHQ